MRSVFSSIMATPTEPFGTISSNMPRQRQGGDLLAPAELMVLLHHSEKEIGLKSCIEGKLYCDFRGQFLHLLCTSYRHLFFDDRFLSI